MKVAVVGTGKTGSQVLKLHKDIVGPFNSKNPAHSKEISQADVAIVFTGGDVFLDIFPELVKARVPVIAGSTGFEWTDEMKKEIQQSGQPWIHANNFSLGMNLMRAALKNFNKLMPLLSNPRIKMLEIHHTHKKDKPSGTAKYWAQWLGYEGDITSIREADVMGIHEASIETELEKIQIKHEAKDRALFAKGALWAAGLILKEEPEPGLYDFQDYIAQKFLGENL